MSKTVGDFVIDRLHEWGVRILFGYPGDGINGVFGALNRAGGKIKFIQVRHEEMAAFMASAYAKFTGELGVCIATSGPGASHLVTGLYDARLDHMPVLAVKNRRRDVTGLLLYSGRHFVQVLEGRRDQLDALVKIIQADTRHAGLRVLVRESIKHRRYGAWAMGFIENLDDADALDELSQRGGSDIHSIGRILERAARSA